MRLQKVILRIVGGAIFAVGVYWFYTILGSHATIAFLMMLLGIELIHTSMGPGKKESA
jgi:hypothetical protein